MIISLQLLLALILGLSLTGVESLAPYLRFIIRNPLFYTGFGWVLFAALMLAVVGLLWLKRWGWVLTMILTGIGLSFGIWAYIQGTPNYLGLVLNIFIVFYLNQRDVQSPFMRRNSPRSVS